MDKYALDNGTKMYIREVSKIPLLSEKEEKELARKVSLGDFEAKKELVRRNLRLVVSIVSKSYNPYTNEIFSFEDLIQEGNIGLINAAENFDLGKGYRFSSYATPLIIYAIKDAIKDKMRVIAMPRYLGTTINTYRKTIDELSVKLGKRPTIKEVADEMGVRVKAIEKALLISDTISLNEWADEDGTELIDLVESNYKFIDEEDFLERLHNDIDNLFIDSGLTDDEILVLRMLNGLDDDQPKTRGVVANALDVSISDVKLIELKALEKIRFSKNIYYITRYTPNPEQALENISILKKLYRLHKRRKYLTKSQKISQK